jgi:hypothetical protein
LFAHGSVVGGCVGMGAKYQPSIKDQKANQRYQRKQNPMPHVKKPTGTPPAKKGKSN